MHKAKLVVLTWLATCIAICALAIVPPRSRTPCWKGLGADSEEKREPVSDINAGLVDSLKALDPNGRLEKLPFVNGLGTGSSSPDPDMACYQKAHSSFLPRSSSVLCAHG